MTKPAGAAETDGADDDWPGPDAPPRHSPVAAAAGAESQTPVHLQGPPARMQVFLFQ